MTCGSCGRENDPDARFCAACGSPLEVHRAADEVRKVVTVVFTDVAGSTALGERLDPESLRRVMWRYFDEMQAVLERHGGTVEKFIGDAVMAVFGVPVVHEDDALRAVRASVEMRAALERLNGELEREQGVRIAVRTGVNTGEVIAGSDGGDQKLATGDAVNVAARLEQAAAAGEVLLGAETYRAVRDAVIVEAAPSVDAKGKTDAVEAWRLLDLRPDVPAFTRPIATAFVGRGRELDDLRRAFEAAVADRSCTLATVVGTPGIGKSRLARELIDSIRAEARVLIGRCVAYGGGIAYLPLAEIVREVAGDDPEHELGSILAAVERGDVAARLIAGAVGSRERAGSPEDTAWAFRRLFETLAAERPLVVVVDDIHWAEPTLLDLIEYVVGFSSDAPIVLLCLTRPDLFDTRPSWAAPRRGAALVSLDPLDSLDAESLVGDLLGGRDLPEPIRRRIVETAEGNPLFVEQLLAMLAEDPEAAEVAVPPTIQALLAARIDRLEPDERAVVQRASVEGRLFHRGALAQLLPQRDGNGLGGILLALARKEFVRPDRSLYPGDDGFRFNHVLIRDVAYGSMPKELRADLHVRLADWLEQHGAAELTGQDEIVGYHLEQAYRWRAELGRVDDDMRAAAVRGGRLLGQAGRRAISHGASATAAALLERACRLLEVEPAERLELLPELGWALRDTGELEAADAVLGEAVEEAKRRGDEPAELRAEIQRARVGFMRSAGDPEYLRGVARRAVGVFEAAGSDADLADAWQLVGTAELAAGDRGAQLEALLRAREHAVASGDTRREIEAWNEVGGAMLFGRTPVAEVLAFLDEELEWANERGIAAVEADALLGGPYLYARLGLFDEARRRLERSKAICREVGIAYGLAEAHMAGAAMELLAGDADAAERELREGIEVAERMGASRYVALYRSQLAHILVSQGRLDDARAELEQARELYAGLPVWQIAHARVLAHRGETEEAVAVARRAANAMAASDDLTARALTLTHFAEVLQLHGDAAGAAEALTAAIGLHEDKGNVVNAERCRDLLAAVEL